MRSDEASPSGNQHAFLVHHERPHSSFSTARCRFIFDTVMILTSHMLNVDAPKTTVQRDLVISQPRRTIIASRFPACRGTDKLKMRTGTGHACMQCAEVGVAEGAVVLPKQRQL